MRTIDFTAAKSPETIGGRRDIETFLDVAARSSANVAAVADDEHGRTTPNGEGLGRRRARGDVQCVSPRDTAQDAARAMRDEELGFLPVCDQSGDVVGTITDRDIAIRLVAEGRPATTPIEDVMSPEVISCSPNDDIQRAQELMAAYQKSRIMCLDASGELVGVISLSDIAHHEQGARAAETLRGVTEREVRI